MNNRKRTQAFPLYKPIQKTPSFGDIIASIDTLRRDVENSANVPVLALWSWLRETNYCFCCSTMVPLFKFCVIDDPCS